jgi:hypothetical protein
LTGKLNESHRNFFRKLASFCGTLKLFQQELIWCAIFSFLVQRTDIFSFFEMGQRPASASIDAHSLIYLLQKI